METLEPRDSASTDTEHQLNFLLVRDYSGDWPRWKQAAVGSAIFHLFAITALFLIKGSAYQPPPPERLYVPHITPLYIPKELTQKAPNKGPVAKLILSAPSAPVPRPLPPAPKVATPAPKPAVSAPPPPAPVPPPVAQPNPTPTEAVRNQPPASSPPPAPVPKPEVPKIIVEDSLQLHPAAPKPNPLNTATNPVQEAMRAAGNGASRGTDSTEVSVGGGLRLPPSAARLSGAQLKSDPMGMDFQPYLQQVLAAVKLNWSAVFPTAARLGTRGVVTLEFAIQKDGTVKKIVYDGQSGSRALDNASVAAISASNPLPPLPKDFKGDTIVLQMSFMYNIPR